MKKILLTSLTVILFAVLSLAQDNMPAEMPAGLASSTILYAELSKSVDAKKLKVNDKVEAKTTVDVLSHSQIVVPRGSKILGHVTEVKPHAKDSPDSIIGIAFDHVTTKDGHELPLNATLRAIGHPLQNSAPAAYSPSVDQTTPSPGMSSGGSGPGGPGGQTSGASAPAARQQPAYPPRTDSYPPSNSTSLPAGYPGSGGGMNPLGPNSQGVIGIAGLSLNSSGSAAVVSSSTGNVHLDSGTQLVFRTQ